MIIEIFNNITITFLIQEGRQKRPVIPNINYIIYIREGLKKNRII